MTASVSPRPSLGRRASKERRDQARKILYAELNLTKAGFSTGGRPSFGFPRCLRLAPGRIVKQQPGGHRCAPRSLSDGYPLGSWLA